MLSTTCWRTPLVVETGGPHRLRLCSAKPLICVPRLQLNNYVDADSNGKIRKCGEILQYDVRPEEAAPYICVTFS